ncbi:hypothetical protein JCM10207_007147 [Rhodosporidiobolus poonsookiae]
MGKVRHRKRTRDARTLATAAPLTNTASHPSTTDDTASTQQTKEKKVGRKEQEISGLLDKLRSPEGRERVWASSTLSSLLHTLPPTQQRLLLSRNLIGLLIERLTLPVPPSSPSSETPLPPSDDLTTAIESLGALRNLAVSSPPHLLSEMHNKRLLLPLTTVHLPLLALYLPCQLANNPAPPKPHATDNLTPAEREAATLAHEAHETLRAGFWDWAENVLVLLWCLAESNTKILAALNPHAGAIVGLCMGFLDAERLGVERVEGLGRGEGEDGMEVEGGGKKKKSASKQAKDARKRTRVPLFVAVAALQTLHAFVSSNAPAHTHVVFSPAAGAFSPSLSSLLAILLAPAPPAGGKDTDASDWAQLRVLAFGVLLEIAKGRSKRRDVEKVREVLRQEEAQGVLLELVKGARLDEVASEGRKVAGEIDPTALPSSASATHSPSSPSAKLAALEKHAQTLQLALEVLAEWLASGVPDSSALAGPDGAEEDEGEGEEMEQEEEEEEEWGGIGMDMDDVDMSGDEDEDEPGAGEEAEDDEDDGIIRKPRPGDDSAMLDDLAATAGASSDSDDDDAPAPTRALKLLGASLPLQLLALAQPTSLSFLPPAAFSTPLDVPSARAAGTALLSTSAADAARLPAALAPLSETLTTLSVRAVEALNNLYVTLSRSRSRGGVPKRPVKDEVQRVFETVLNLMHGALGAAEAVASSGETGAGQLEGEAAQKGRARAQGREEGEADELQERRMEVVMAGAGVVWGCVRLGLEQETKEQLVVGPSTTPFLAASVYPSAFAAAPTPAGEAIRVRVLGCLGWLGRRRDVPVEENAQIGSFLLSLLPSAPSSPPNTNAASTPDVLLQAIDSLIDLYADEERAYDVPVFREGGMLEGLEGAVGGVRAAIKKIDRKKFPDLRHRADGALENLVAFVQYRKEVVRPAPAAGKKGGRR